jgi:hypothetical protein
MNRLFKIILLTNFIWPSLVLSAGVDHGFTITTDVSYTSARELWKGNSEEVTFQDAEGDVHTSTAGNPLEAKTKFYNFGLTIGYQKLPFGLTTELRLDYTVSKIRNATHPNPANGMEDSGLSRLSGAELKLSKNIINNNFSFGTYFSFRHPIDSKPTAPSFIALNDFSTHLSFGLNSSYKLTPSTYLYYDVKYTKRSLDSKYDSFDLLSNKINMKIDLLYLYDQKISFGGGLVWNHTFSGPDISTSEFGSATTAIKHPVFYLARERFLADNFYLNYYYSHSSWYGVSRLQKIWGRNTDRSTTTTVYYGFSF